MGSSTGTKREKAMKESTLAISLLCLGCFLSIDKVQGYRYDCQNEGEDGKNGKDYEGNITKTVSGYKCQKWSEQKPHKHKFAAQGKHNFCRNPDGHKGVWCYTTARKRWEECDVPVCPPPPVKDIEDSMAKEVEALKNNMVKKTELQENMDSMAKEVEALKNNMAKEVKALKNNMVKKTELQENMDSTAKEVEELKKKMVKKTELQENMNRLSENSARLDKLSQRGAYCGYRGFWSTPNRVITYQRLMLSEGDAGVLARNTGVFRASVSGLFQINWSLFNRLKGNEENRINLYRNGKRIYESEHASYIEYSTVRERERVIAEMGGRTMLLRLWAGDTLKLRSGKTSSFEGTAYKIHFCVMLLAAV